MSASEWEGIQQTQMRQATVKAGLVPDMATGHVRIAFVTKGETSFHFAIKHGLPAQATNLKVSSQIFYRLHSSSLLTNE